VLYGYEWTNTVYGHRNVYSTDNSIPFLPASEAAYFDIENLWKNLSGYNVITVPHHPMIWSTKIWWDYTNPEMEPLVEFYSKWGTSLRFGNPRPVFNSRKDNAVFKAFSAGKRYGLIASTDSHASRPASILLEDRPQSLLYAQPGTVGVWAGAHTREAIFEALKKRRCYGMTGTKVNLAFAVNDSNMGSDIQASASPTISFKVSSETIIKQVTVIKFSGGLAVNLKVFDPDSNQSSQSFADDTFLEDAGYTVMVNLDNGDMAIASPVWVKKIKSASVI